MSIQEVYEKMGEDYSEVLERMAKEERVIKYVKKFSETTNFDALKKAVSDKDIEVIFREAHTIKGMSLNLGFSKLADATAELCDDVRNNIVKAPVEPFMEIVETEYQNVISCIQEMDD